MYAHKHNLKIWISHSVVSKHIEHSVALCLCPLLASYFNACVYMPPERSIMCILYRLRAHTHTRHLAFHLPFTAFEPYNHFVIRKMSETWQKGKTSLLIYIKSEMPICRSSISNQFTYKLSIQLFCFIHCITRTKSYCTALQSGLALKLCISKVSQWSLDMTISGAWQLDFANLFYYIAFSFFFSSLKLIRWNPIRVPHCNTCKAKRFCTVFDDNEKQSITRA